MLQQIRLENFKGFKQAVVDFGRITVLIGPNGTGKSSISHALMALRQSIGHTNLLVNGPLINLGDFDDVLNKQATNGQVKIGVSVGVADYQTLGIPQDTSFSYDAYFVPQLVSFDASISSTKGEHYIVKLDPAQATVEPPTFVWRFGHSSEISIKLKPAKQVALPVSVGSASHSEGFKDKAEAFTGKLKELFSAINRMLNKTHYVPAIRGLEQPSYPLTTEPSIDLPPGKNMELASTFAYAGRDVEEIVSVWSEAITGSELGPKIVPGRLVAIKSYVVSGGIPVIGDGSGTNQLVQLLLTLAITPEQSLLAIEEPEIHLHPKAQEKLCDILVEISKTRDKQLVVTTHSQHILYAFVQAVKNGTLTTDELAIYYFEEKGEEPRKVEQDECGDIYDWGKNFFSMP